MVDTFSLEGRTVVVTGGTGVLGYAFNKVIAAHGGNVVLLGTNENKGEERAAEINSYTSGGKAIFVKADVTKEEDLEKAKEHILSHFGSIDGLVNAAGGNKVGAVVENGQDIFELNIGALKDIMNLNLFGTLLPTQIFGKALSSSKFKASIINISSVSAHKALSKVLGYSLSKSAIEAYTKWMAVEIANRIGDKIRVNALVPGFFLTTQNKALLTKEDGSLTERGNNIIRQTPFKRFGTPEELTGALVWLLSEASTFVNGASIVVDGGFLINSGV